jgi:hypothetical protein
MAYETISKGLDYICKTGKALGASALIIMPFAGPLGCTAAQAKAPVVQMDNTTFLEVYKKKADSYNKDKVINQDEIPDILADREAVKAFKENLKGDGAVVAAMRQEATAIESTLNGYLTSLLSDPRLKANIVLIRQGTGQKDSVRISGANKGDHIAYGGLAREHIVHLGVKADDIYSTIQADGNWGYKPGELSEIFTREAANPNDEQARKTADKVRRNFATRTIEVVLADYGANVPRFFPGSEVNDKGEFTKSGEVRAKDGLRMTVKKFQDELAKGAVRHVKLVYVLEHAEGEKSEEDRLLEKLQERMREKEELPPKPQPRPRPSGEEKKGKGIPKFGDE